MRNKGLALEDIIKGMHKLVLQTQFPMKMKALIIEEISEIEYRLSFGGIEKIQVAAFIGSFINCRTIQSN
jgi:DNA polymerase III delta prime subunit